MYSGFVRGVKTTGNICFDHLDCPKEYQMFGLDCIIFTTTQGSVS